LGRRFKPKRVGTAVKKKKGGYFQTATKAQSSTPELKTTGEKKRHGEKPRPIPFHGGKQKKNVDSMGGSPESQKKALSLMSVMKKVGGGNVSGKSVGQGWPRLSPLNETDIRPGREQGWAIVGKAPGSFGSYKSEL